jgi:hypothetical protein
MSHNITKAEETPGRLTAFALWVAARATLRKGKAGGAAAGLLKELRALLDGLDKFRSIPIWAEKSIV